MILLTFNTSLSDISICRHFVKRLEFQVGHDLEFLLLRVPTTCLRLEFRTVRQTTFQLRVPIRRLTEEGRMKRIDEPSLSDYPITTPGRKVQKVIFQQKVF